MKKVLFAWIGKNDLDAASNNGAYGLGAICQAITTRQFDVVILLSDWSTCETSAYSTWLEQCVKVEIILRLAKLSDPTDLREVYDHAKKGVYDYLNASKAVIELTFHLSSGTWAMATVWIILANSFFTAKLIQTSKAQGLKYVDFPFDLAVDYLPDLLRRKDERVGRLFDKTTLVAPEFQGIIHRSQAMKNLVAKSKTVAPHFIPVLVQGESGTGKELLAKAIHNGSLRKGKFVAVNCGAIPSELVESELFGHKKGAFTGATEKKDGYVKAAEGGTLFLDEVGELPLAAQVKLLRLLQEGTFTPVGETVPKASDARIIAATNRNLIDEIGARRFREDLFHRLAVAILLVPPLRERQGDIGLLVDHLIDVVNKKLSASKGFTEKKLSAAAKTSLLQHAWPGNVRELQNTLIRAALWSRGNTLEKQDIIEALLPVSSKDEQCNILGHRLGVGFELEEIISDVARHYLGQAMKETAGNKSKAAKLLGFKSYQTLDNWLIKYNVASNDDI